MGCLWLLTDFRRSPWPLPLFLLSDAIISLISSNYISLSAIRTVQSSYRRLFTLAGQLIVSAYLVQISLLLVLIHCTNWPDSTQPWLAPCCLMYLSWVGLLRISPPSPPLPPPHPRSPLWWIQSPITTHVARGEAARESQQFPHPCH